MLGSTGLKAIGGLLMVILSSGMGSFAQDILYKVRMSIQGSEMLMIDGYLQVHFVERNRYPRNQKEFDAALEEYFDARNRQVTDDRWGTSYRFIVDGRRAYRIFSSGPDRIADTPDDLILTRVSQRVHLNKDPVAIAESAIQQAQQQREEQIQAISELLEKLEEFSGDASSDDAGEVLQLDQDQLLDVVDAILEG